MPKLFEIVPRHQAWDVLHNQINFRSCQHKREAIRLALALGRMQQKLGDQAEVILRDKAGAMRASRQFPRAAAWRGRAAELRR